MFDNIFVLLAMLVVKHWYIDFINQSVDEMTGKGIYGNAHGLMHSIKHGAATFLIMCCFLADWPFAVVIGFIDFIIHYHVDYIKVRFGTKDMSTSAFWAQFGLDQLVHNLTYIWIVWIII
jgi:hypothetical protein